MVDSQFTVIRNLNDAGCDAHTKEKFLEFYFSEKKEDGLRLLQRHRRALLDELHNNQKKIDCIDFFIFKLQHGDAQKTL